MDNLTHTLCGVALGEAFFRERDGRRAVTISAWAANLPDVDAAVMLLRDPGAIVLRRSFGHSVLLLPLWALGMSWLFKKRYPDMDLRRIGAIVGINAAVHLLLDFINSFGVQFLWPLTVRRWELGTTFIVDLALLGFFAAPHLARLSKALRPRLKEAARAGLAAAAVYLLASLGLRARAAALLRQARPDAGFAYVFPEPFGPRRWRGVTRDGSQYSLWLIRPLQGTIEPRGTVATDDAAPAAVAAAESPFGERLLTFFKAPVWSVDDAGKTARVYDLRFTSLVIRRDHAFGFAFDLGPDGRATPRDARIW